LVVLYEKLPITLQMASDIIDYRETNGWIDDPDELATIPSSVVTDLLENFVVRIIHSEQIF